VIGEMTREEAEEWKSLKKINCGHQTIEPIEKCFKDMVGM
jgi:hypothetical protein